MKLERVAACVALIALCIVPERARAQRAWQTPGEADAAEGRELAQQGRCEEALAAFDRSIRHRTEDATLRRDRGRCHDRLENPLPAIDDYRAYLSMQPDGPDAGEVRARLAALEKQHAEATEPPPEPKPRRAGEPTEREATDSEREEEPEAPRRVPSHGWLLGVHLGGRDWVEQGMRGLTFSYGVEGGYAYLPIAEVDVRLTLLSTKDEDASGWGISAAHTWKIALDDERRGEVLFSVGAGYETQKDDLRRTREFFFGRLSPGIRWSIHPSVVLQGGPELAMGTMPPPPETQALEAAEDRFTMYLGLHVALLWEITARE